MNQDQQPWQPTNQPPAPGSTPVYSPSPPAQPMSPIYPEQTSAPAFQAPQQNPQVTPQSPFEMQSQPMQQVQPVPTGSVQPQTLATAVPQVTKPAGVPLFVWIIFIGITLGVAGLAAAVILMK